MSGNITPQGKKTMDAMRLGGDRWKFGQKSCTVMGGNENTDLGEKLYTCPAPGWNKRNISDGSGLILH